MNKIYKFKNREEIIEFLNGYGFKYYVPRLEEKMNKTPTKNKYYTVEVSQSNKIIFCSVEKDGECRNGYTDDFIPFYDCNRAYDFYTKEAGEENYKEWLEIRQYDID